MDYIEEGSLRKNLPKIVKNNWYYKLFKLYKIITGLNGIHQENLIHCDFHDGNILNFGKKESYISDLGLCRTAKYFQSSKKHDIYGVIPFMAPEVLRGKPYTLASDIYSFSMIMWEYTSGVPPFNDKAHDLQLCLSICKGERPKIIENTPQCYANLMEKCWNEDPLKRPSASEIQSIIRKWIDPNFKDINEENIMEFIKANENSTILTTISDKPITKPHPQAYYTSRLLNFTKKLNEILDQDSQSECLDCVVTDLKSSGIKVL
jgi:serine/threonine protein kinase